MERKMNEEKEYLGWCPDLAKRFNIKRKCCDSCHYDDDYGHCYLGEIEFEDGYFDVCCTMREVVNASNV